jgi:probable phosphoglycerate mutase
MIWIFIFLEKAKKVNLNRKMMIRMQKLYLVRHGKTKWNNLGIMQGINDIPLIPEGIEDAKKLAFQIDLNEIDLCLSSPLSRAYETAKILCQNKLEIITDKRLIERSYGEYEGKKIDFDEVKKHWDYKLNSNENNIESLKDCLKRAKDFLDDIKIKYPDKTLLIVTHGSFMKALHFNLIGYDNNTDFMAFNPQNTTIYLYKQ